jgi:hypothetical protein
MNGVEVVSALFLTCLCLGAVLALYVIFRPDKKKRVL